MTRLPAVLASVDENWTTALAVVAHPDDLEYGVAGAIARWTAQGKRITYCLATSGEAGIDQMRPEEAGPLREQEQHAAAEIVGVQDVWFLGHPDGMVECGLVAAVGLNGCESIGLHRKGLWRIGLSHNGTVTNRGCPTDDESRPGTFEPAGPFVVGA
jgi:LmbE family N-acetylglucosaminyl deacetylase